MSTRLDDVRLPQLSATATEWDRQLLRALYDQLRDITLRLWAIENTIGMMPRHPTTIKRATMIIMADSGDAPDLGELHGRPPGLT